MVATLSFILYAVVSGYMEGYFWAAKPKVNQHLSHAILAISRGLVLIPILVYEGWQCCFAAAAFFPLIHDGVYYMTRNHINPDVYPDGFTDTSLSTGAIFSLSFPYRLLLAVLGLLVLFI